MLRRNLALVVSLFTLISNAKAEDFGIYMPDDPNLESVYEKSNPTDEDPYLLGTPVKDYLTGAAALPEEPKLLENQKLTEEEAKKKELESFNFNVLGTVPESTSYEKIDKKTMVRNFRSHSEGAINLSYIQNGYDYGSKGDIINQTVDTGFHSGKGGTLLLRHDSYMSRARFLNTYWSLGGGIGYSTGRAFFIDGSRSETTINLWEIPLEAGLGFEIPIASWFKIAATGGGGGLVLAQNRSDLGPGEKGKRKFQVSPGYFGSAQFKINLTGFSNNFAYDVFTASDITNISLNFEARHQSYENFQDEITVSGTSFGVGFTFEYL